VNATAHTALTLMLARKRARTLLESRAARSWPELGECLRTVIAAIEGLYEDAASAAVAKATIDLDLASLVAICAKRSWSVLILDPETGAVRGMVDDSGWALPTSSEVAS
jgi:hypothetical protein